ncbi:hypothetical protein AB0E83_09610 [Streptomyces sp. NPDC035033]|uniref:hypothetical protein n=1 Tax=Streptomyces sp. NPDC035033 TaxID=3155368 RepID=UPI0033CEA469
MSPRQRGFALVTLPPVPEAVAAGFGALPRTAPAAPAAPAAPGPPAGEGPPALPPGRPAGTHRSPGLRLRMSWTADDDWLFRPLPRRPADGAERRLTAALSGLLRRALSDPWLGVHEDWLISLHHVRTVAPAGRTVRVHLPGPRPEPCPYKLVAVVGGNGTGACHTRLYAPGRTAPLAEVRLGPGQGLLMDRHTVTLDAHELTAAATGPAVRDLLTASVSRWTGPPPPTTPD